MGFSTPIQGEVLGTVLAFKDRKNPRNQPASVDGAEDGVGWEDPGDYAEEDGHDADGVLSRDVGFFLREHGGGGGFVDD